MPLVLIGGILPPVGSGGRVASRKDQVANPWRSLLSLKRKRAMDGLFRVKLAPHIVRPANETGAAELFRSCDCVAAGLRAGYFGQYG